MKAIILSAGRGTRISRYVDTPKSILEINGVPLIRRTVQILRSKGIETAVCLGYQQEKIKDILSDMDVNFFYNPFFDITNSIGSLWFAKDYINGDTLLLNGDVYFDEAILDMLINSKHNAVMLADKTRTIKGDYFFGINDNNNTLEKYGTDLSPELRTAEYVGMAKISSSFVEVFINRLNELVDSQKHDLWWEDILYSFVGKHDIKTLDVDGRFWAEIDYLDDYERILDYVNNDGKFNETNRVYTILRRGANS